MRKIIFTLAATFFVLSFISCMPAKVSSKEAEKQTAPQVETTPAVPFSDITVLELTKAMGAGWNLGNTFDATGSFGMDSETSWGQPETTKAMIDGLVESGIKTIRIPVSWHNHLTETTNHTISAQWMARVKTVVDWAIEDGLYVIIDSHHDNYLAAGKMPAGAGYYPTSQNLEESKRFLKNIWTQIGTTFNNDYDEHLIFETMNEPRPAGTKCEWWFDKDELCVDAMKCVMELNQTALDAIRATGGNNKKRFVMCPSLQASQNAATSSLFKMPVDLEEGRLILSIHAYTPYTFAMENPGTSTFSQAHKDELNTLFSILKNRFVAKGYGVVIGEYGATNKENLSDRVAWFDYYVTMATAAGIPCILWDNGVWWITRDEVGVPDYSEGYGFYNRTEQTWYFPEILEVIVK